MSKSLPETLSQWAAISDQQSMYAFGHFLRSRGVSMPQIMLLMYLLHSGPRTVSDIGRHLEITNPAASQLIQRLVEQTYLQRREGQTDRRVKEVFLTETGRALIHEALRARSAWIKNLAALLPTEDQHVVDKALQCLITAAQENTFPHPHKEN